jgi:hypothetical protein
VKTLSHIRQSTCLYLQSGSLEYEAQTLFAQPGSCIIILIIFYTSWAKVPVTAIYVWYHLSKTLNSALNVNCLSASFKSLVLTETRKTYHLLHVPLSSLVTYLLSGLPTSAQWNIHIRWYCNILKMARCSVSRNSSCCHNSPNGSIPYGVHVRLSKVCSVVYFAFL